MWGIGEDSARAGPLAGAEWAKSLSGVAWLQLEPGPTAQPEWNVRTSAY